MKSLNFPFAGQPAMKNKEKSWVILTDIKAFKLKFEQQKRGGGEFAYNNWVISKRLNASHPLLF